MRTVTIFGAGIAGLTAAHELASRGFRVRVIERDAASAYEPSVETGSAGITPDVPCAVGGMARSQWQAVDVGLAGSGRRPFPKKGLPRSRGPFSGLPVAFDLPYDAKVLTKEATKACRDVADALRADASLLVIVDVRGRKGTEQKRRLKLLQSAVAAHGSEGERLLDANVENVEASETISFYPLDARIPGEHGFRFFPAFYRHLFDTMKRTPILPESRQPHEQGATVFDNLTPSDTLGIAVRGGRSFTFRRGQERSFEEVRKVVRALLQNVGYTVQDMVRMELKLFQYLTTSIARRKHEFEDQSWLDFVEAWRFSPRAREHLESAPQTFGALRASLSDARTQGDATIQLILDQFTTGERTDFTLDGPTSTAWFRHWRTYLQQQGVVFERGTLKALRRAGDRLVPEVEGRFKPSDAYVLALSLLDMRALLDEFDWQGSADEEDFIKIRDFFPKDWRDDLALARPKGPLQHLSGIQFYFDCDVPISRGHTVYLDSSWGLTSISQPQFWRREREPADSYRGVLSVDIANWYTPGLLTTKTAWECTPDEIAADVWAQIRVALEEPSDPTTRLPDFAFYHLDDNISPDPDKRQNKTPFLVNQTGQFHKRPGTPGHYRVRFGQWVLAGGYMQTKTRLTTMESANESARHAVNALLDHFDSKGPRCHIWDPEANEVSDLQTWRDLDLKLFRRGAPHLIEILELDRLPERLFPSASMEDALQRDEDERTDP